MMKLQQTVSTKWLIVIELLIAIGLVIAANIFDLLPYSETPYILILVLLSFALHKTGLSSLGFRKPKSWVKTIGIGLIAAVGLQLFSSYITEPFFAKLTGAEADTAQFNVLKGNTKFLLKYLVLAWTLAAFGEEIVFRGFIANKFAALFGSTNKALWAGVIMSSILFGLAHYYKGPAGMIDSTLSGLIFGSVYILSGRNLWVSIFAHGFTDTYGVLYFYLGYFQ